MKLYEPNWEHVREEADKVRDSDQQGGLRDIERYGWKDGENNHRLMPPYNAKGLFFRKFGTHFNIKPDNDVRDCLMSWPDEFDSCPICIAIERILKAIPKLDLGRTETAWAYLSNIIDRDEDSKGPQICRYTQGVRNWYMLQFDNRKIGDLTDIERGFDTQIIKKDKKRGKGKGTFVDYKPDRDPDRSPLHEEDEMVAKWLGEMFDLDKIMAPPDDDKLAEIRGMAKAMERYYMKKYRESDDDYDSPRRGRREKEYDDQEDNRRRDEPEDRDVKKPDDDDKHERRARADKANDIGDVKPTDLPACHAALGDPEMHKDGTVGFNHDLEICLLCDEELSCLNAAKARGES